MIIIMVYDHSTLLQDNEIADGYAMKINECFSNECTHLLYLSLSTSKYFIFTHNFCIKWRKIIYNSIF